MGQNNQKDQKGPKMTAAVMLVQNNQKIWSSHISHTILKVRFFWDTLYIYIIIIIIMIKYKSIHVNCPADDPRSADHSPQPAASAASAEGERYVQLHTIEFSILSHSRDGNRNFNF